jgi:hypothetical protein
VLALNSGGRRFCAGMVGLIESRTIDVAALRGAACQIADRLDEFALWLAELREDDTQVRAITARSYWHPNGFAKLVLPSESTRCKLRLHVWSAANRGPRLGESNPHSHRWEFASTVVAGDGLHMVEYEETRDAGSEYERFRYGADQNDPAALLPAGSARLAVTATPPVQWGQIYSCDTTVVHTVAPIGDDLTATLVVQGPPRSSSTVVYRTPGLGADQPNGVLTESDFRTLTDAVLTAYTGT